MSDGSHAVTVISPYDVYGSGERGPYPFELFHSKCLAQGDSWFSIGSIPPGLTTNILAELELTNSVVVVNCARPGKELQHMTDTTTEPMFDRLLAGKLALRWDAILLSGGGNDLIDAATVGPTATADKRLLATPAERGTGPLQADQYISARGWATFETHLTAVFNAFVDRRDSGINKDVPLVFHTYAHIMPRPAPAGPGHGPWLQPAMVAFAIPPAAWLSVSDALIDKLAGLFSGLIGARQAKDPNCSLYMVDTRWKAQLTLADQAATGPSADFENEIHPTVGGYKKLGVVWRETLDTLI